MGECTRKVHQMTVGASEKPMVACHGIVADGAVVINNYCSRVWTVESMKNLSPVQEADLLSSLDSNSHGSSVELLNWQVSEFFKLIFVARWRLIIFSFFPLGFLLSCSCSLSRRMSSQMHVCL